MDEVPRYSREPVLAWAAVDRLKSGMQLGCTCWRDETGDGRVSYDCWISVGDEHGLRVTDFRECGHGEALAICRTLLDVLRANPAELTA